MKRYSVRSRRACTSSGVVRGGKPGTIGTAANSGCCHTFSADGRCVSLLKVLYTKGGFRGQLNVDAEPVRQQTQGVGEPAYCVNRRSNDVPRTAFTPRELAELTIQFYRRNYIEGLFLSSAVLKDPDYTTERMIETLRLDRFICQGVFCGPGEETDSPSWAMSLS